jgi:hypothetical protein
MIVKDSEKLLSDAKLKKFEIQRDKQKQAVALHESQNAVTIAPDAGRDTTNPLEAGRMMRCGEIQKRLRKLNPGFSFELATADSSKTGIYISDGVSNPGTPYSGRRFVCGMESGFSPEFSIRKTDGLRIIGEVRGWRTVLAMLIRSRLIEKTAAEDAFGINFGRESANWQKFVN